MWRPRWRRLSITIYRSWKSKPEARKRVGFNQKSSTCLSIDSYIRRTLARICFRRARSRVIHDFCLHLRDLAGSSRVSSRPAHSISDGAPCPDGSGDGLHFCRARLFKARQAIRGAHESVHDTHFFATRKSPTARCCFLHCSSIFRSNPGSRRRQYSTRHVVGPSGRGLCRDFAWTIWLLVGLPRGNCDYLLIDVRHTSGRSEEHTSEL